MLIGVETVKDIRVKMPLTAPDEMITKESLQQIYQLLQKKDIPVNGVYKVGAARCVFSYFHDPTFGHLCTEISFKLDSSTVLCM